MKILAIETSCDDTGLAIVDIDGASITILSNIVNTQTIHAGYGGVFPAMAKQEHIKNIGGVYEEVMKEAGSPTVDAIAVTVGPGLEPSLWVGITFAVELSKKLNVPLIPVNHMEGHLLSSLLPEYTINKKILLRDMPQRAISLLVSGGHTQLIDVDGLGKYKIIGTTVDDAVGEAFDKVARMLDLPYPGGPAISKLAEMGRQKDQESKLNFPRPMLHSKDFNFSFSGLKTAILYHIRDNPIKSEDDKIAIAREFEDAAIEVIIKKTVRSINESGSTHLLLGGGVAANKHLQRELETASKKEGFVVYYPVKQITGDNALMIAIAGYFQTLRQEPTFDTNLFKANGSLKL
jgi:N6-L-threonylcarbamoyladenine synthase